MLIGYYLGNVARERVVAPLADQGTFERSEFSTLPLSRQGMLCEFHFYDAPLAKVRGDGDGMIRGLKATIDTGYRPYNEYKMAKFIIKNLATFLPRGEGTIPG